ncbi:putative membrane protein [Rhodobacteraceae bacterium MBR-64]
MSKQPVQRNTPSDINTPQAPQNPLEQEIERQIGDLIPQKGRQEVLRRITSVVYSEAFSGPIAHPKHLREYDQIHPGAADRIILMAEKRNNHIITMEQTSLNAEISDRKLGMWLGAGTFGLLILGAILSALFTKSEIIPGLFLGAAALGGVGMFIRGRNGSG